MKAVDVDALLAEGKLSLTLGGKTYEIVDVPLPVFLRASEEPGEEPDREILHKQLAEIFGVNKDELAGVGLRAATLAMQQIRDWILNPEDTSTEIKDVKKKGGVATTPVNP